jgi:hypothetical protein
LSHTSCDQVNHVNIECDQIPALCYEIRPSAVAHANVQCYQGRQFVQIFRLGEQMKYLHQVLLCSQQVSRSLSRFCTSKLEASDSEVAPSGADGHCSLRDPVVVCASLLTAAECTDSAGAVTCGVTLCRCSAQRGCGHTQRPAGSEARRGIWFVPMAATNWQRDFVSPVSSWL